MDSSNGASTGHGTPDLGRPQSAARVWFEPLLIVCLMLSSLYFNRRRSYRIVGRGRERGHDGTTTQNLLRLPGEDYDSDGESGYYRSRSPSPMKSNQSCCGISIEVPDSSRFGNHFHSRILQKFPFLIEMFYWALNYVAYSLTKKVAAAVYGRGGNQVTAMAQENGISILTLEHNTWLSIFFPIHEVELQSFFLNNHKSFITFFNQIYSLVHIPGTVAFLSWYYWAAPNHETFAIARRTMTLGNFSAFIIFCFYPCMPPRLLPESFGFKDTVRQENAESVWVGGNNVNQLAAMPSLHFTYAFVIGCTFMYHSGVFQALQGRATPGRSPSTMCGFILAAIFYPLLVLTVIVATANHYYFDATVATISVAFSFLCNRIWLALLPAEGVLCWILRLKKPEPSTGQRYRWRDQQDLRPKITVV
ncbi:hypothetical protein EJ03DRAFT_151236 [Teratosphaeria nubilosa]|uniref:Inositolphosphotransferase Aur1/Ipt1 domain-containing protein n=1 Tax=Teratosphaeria nubilosa TaxID=161662 RepID=A0A6G1LJ82_9PEZI|nr:hypothetical protein EJ03DRAFT_151236 [Teratosphaeria nubilosa]